MTPLANHPSAVRALSALTFVVPVALLFSVYTFAALPRLSAARAARAEADAIRGQRTAAEEAVQTRSGVSSGESAAREFEIRIPDENRVLDVLRTLTQLASSPSVGKLEALVIEAGSPGVDAAPDPRLTLFGSPVSGTPVTMSFEASYEQLGRFFWHLRALPTTVDVRSIDVSPAPQSSLLRVKMLLLAFHRAGLPTRLPLSGPRSTGGPSQRPAVSPDVAQLAAPPAVDVTRVPRWPRDLFRSSASPVAVAEVTPDPVVQTILYSPQRSVALVDGKIVKVGDRLGAGSVIAIERDAVVIETPSGGRKRLALRSPTLQGTIRSP